MIDRKEFIKSLAFIVAGGISTTVFESCASVKYLNYSTDENKIVVTKSEFKGNQFALINTTNLPAPVYLRNIGEDKYIALLTRCTHKGCIVDAYYDRLSCPCHGSEYSYSGEVISPPAADNLMKFNVTTDSINIYIHIKEN
ncbi:MAG TPA: Rieske 2Fe-2S domain-containing protein [Ignavibacteriaceae bacterium]|nr:Rieske 2Fe-2S domain-containing protein [Ignavibacteriaceae bacterium]